MADISRIAERARLIGLKARSADGKRLGKVAVADEAGLVIEKWLPLPTQYFVSYEDVRAIGPVEIQVARNRRDLRREPFVEENETIELISARTATSYFETGQDDEPRGPTIRAR